MVRTLRVKLKFRNHFENIRKMENPNLSGCIFCHKIHENSLTYQGRFCDFKCPTFPQGYRPGRRSKCVESSYEGRWYRDTKRKLNYHKISPAKCVFVTLKMNETKVSGFMGRKQFKRIKKADLWYEFNGIIVKFSDLLQNVEYMSSLFPKINMKDNMLDMEKYFPKAETIYKNHMERKFGNFFF